MFEEYIQVGSKKLRLGYTTGTCATLAAKAAFIMLLSQERLDQASIQTPSGKKVTVDIEEVTLTPQLCKCAVRKDAGDDIDATHGALIVAEVQVSDQGITIDGGKGVGRVTKKGLDLDVGQAAINKTPQLMIRKALTEVMEAQNHKVGVHVLISVPEGERIAKKTFNERLGIEGGISIIGTTGIVEPKSNSALIKTIEMELKVLRQEGHREIVLSPGHLGEHFWKEQENKSFPLVQYSNFLGEALDNIIKLGFKKIHIVSHLGKLSKVAAGIMNTHSHYADGRHEVFITYGMLEGLSVQRAKGIFEQIKVRGILDCIEEEIDVSPVVFSILKRVRYHIDRRLEGKVEFDLLTYEGERYWRG